MHLDGVVEGCGREDAVEGQVLPHHVDDAPSRRAAHARMAGIGGGNGRRAWQRQAKRFRDRHHGRGRSHHHAGAEGARDAGLHLLPLRVGDVAGALLHPVFPDVGAGTEILPVPVAAQHRAGRHVDCRNPHADGAHDQAGRGLVAAAEQHRAVNRMATQQLLRLHRQEVAIEHGRRLHERLGKRHRRQLDRKAAGLQDTAFHVLGALAQMRVTGVDLAPGIEDADDRLAAPVVGIVAELLEARAVAERAHVVNAEPAMAAQMFGPFSARHRWKLRRRLLPTIVEA